MVGWMYILVGQDVCFSTPRPIVVFVCHNLFKEVRNMIVVSLFSFFLSFFLFFLNNLTVQNY
jgi:hypothetical protein